MPSPSSSPTIAVHNAPDQSIGAFSNAPNPTSLTDGVTNHDRSTHNGPQSDSAAGKDSLEEGKERSRSESRILASLHASDASQEQPSVQYLLHHKYVECDQQHVAAMNEQVQKTRGLNDEKLEKWSQHNTTLTTSHDLHNKEQTTVKRKKFPDPWMVEIVPGLFLGDVPAATCPEMLRENNIDAIVSLCDYVYGWRLVMPIIGMETKRHIFIRCEDSPTLDLLGYMSDICDFIDRMASPALQQSSFLPPPSSPPPPSTLLPPSAVPPPPSGPPPPSLSPSGSILVHCMYGRSRSPAVIIAYLMRKYCLKCDDALSYVRTKRRVKPRTNLLQQLRIWEQVRYNVWEDDEKKIPKAPYRAYLDRAVQIGGKRDHNAIMSTRGALDALYPIGPKLEPPYCCLLVGDCPCKDLALPSASNLKQ